MQARLQEIMDMVEKATKGPWGYDKIQAFTFSVSDNEYVICESSNRNDANFIAHARQDVPWLVEKLGEVLENFYVKQQELQRTEDRERVLWEALEKIIDRYNIPQNDLKNHVGDLMCQIARKALHQTNKSTSNAKIVANFTRQEDKPNGNN